LFNALQNSKVDKLFLPLENKLSGNVTPVWLGLTKYNFYIEAAFDYPITYVLATPPETTEIKSIVGFSHALMQCSDFLSKNYPNLKIINSASNSHAMRRAKKLTNAAAITTAAAAKEQGAKVVKQVLSKADGNITRFGLVGKNKIETAQSQITSIVFGLANQQGSLLKALTVLDNHNKNMISIASHPTGNKMNEYVFFVDIEGKLDQQAKQALINATNNLQILGEYNISRFD